MRAAQSDGCSNALNSAEKPRPFGRFRPEGFGVSGTK